MSGVEARPPGLGRWSGAGPGLPGSGGKPGRDTGLPGNGDEQGRGSGLPGQGPGPERLARAALTRVLEPGDERAGAWLRQNGPVALLRALRVADGSAERLPGMTAARLEGYRLRAAAAEPERDLAAAAAVGGRLVCPGDREWPSQLDDLGDARPVGLWVRGLPDLRLWALRSVAVVGARACTPYGAHMAATLGAGLAERGWVVMSGAAFGVDGAAHRGVLAVGGATVAVLACGVDVPYPRGHAELIGRVAQQGLLVAELPPGSHPTRSRFVLRNRVMPPSLGQRRVLRAGNSHCGCSVAASWKSILCNRCCAIALESDVQRLSRNVDCWGRAGRPKLTTDGGRGRSKRRRASP